MIQLKKTTPEDLKTLFVFQSDETACHMAAFTPKDPGNEEAYLTKWTRIVGDPGICMQTIRVEGKIVGSIVHFEMMDETNVSYWIDRNYWGQGIATEALKQFLTITEKRPLYARTAFDNTGSQKVLEKCGFKRTGREQGFANARNLEIEEFLYLLEV